MRLTLLAAVLLLLACNRKGPTIDLDNRRPATLEGTWHVSWTLHRYPTMERVSCNDARALYVFVRMAGIGSSGSRSYRMQCGLPGQEAWIPVERGQWMIRPELVGFTGATLSTGPERSFEVGGTKETLATPLVFQVK